MVHDSGKTGIQTSLSYIYYLHLYTTWEISVVQIQILPYFHVESRDSQIWKPPISTGQATQVIAAGERYTKLLSFVDVSMFRCSLARQVTWASRLSFDKEKQLKVAMNGFGMTDEAGLRVAPHICLCTYLRYHLDILHIYWYYLSSFIGFIETFGAMSMT